jgi:phospholipid-binding lipoprotein MlaA
LLRRARGFACAVVASCALSACATNAADPAPVETQAVPAAADSGDGPSVISVDPNVVSYEDYSDPLMPFNRAMFRFNEDVGRYVLIPVGKAYTRVVPPVVDRRVDSFFDNAATPVYAVNELLQLDVKPAGTNLLRFGINTTVGLLGLFDPAKAWFGLERTPSDFSDTLAHYDVGYGTSVVLPFCGPSNLRTTAARTVDYFFNPIPYVLERPNGFILLSDGWFHDFAGSAEDYETLLEETDDPYIFLRNLHLQSIQRDAAYRD